MNNERLKILELLQEGKITVEDSLKLLDAVEPKEERKKIKIFKGKTEAEKQANENNEETTIFVDGEEIKKVNSLDSDIKEKISQALENITSSVKNVVNDLGDINISFGDSGQPFNLTSEPLENVKKLNAKAKNGSIFLTGYTGETVIINGNFREKNGKNPNFALVEEDGVLTLDYDKNAVRFVKFNIKVPTKMIKEINLQTSNSGINLSEFSCEDIFAKSTNGKIVVEQVDCDTLDLDTSNSKIEISDTIANTTKLETSNGTINVYNLTTNEINADTSNGSVKIYGITPKENTAILNVDTSNGSVTIDTSKIPATVTARTSIGKVTLPEGYIQKIGSGGKTPNTAYSEYYEIAEKKLNITVDTSNANIKIS
ncbi:MAG: DUF4097 domain-containing protein [Defluviitaleaceae bacterium]|nr:DUF4097 domain-containing protein [Defluviitaleaceae bacterium]